MGRCGVVYLIEFGGSYKSHKLIGSKIIYHKPEVGSQSGISNDLNGLHDYRAGIEQVSK